MSLSISTSPSVHLFSMNAASILQRAVPFNEIQCATLQHTAPATKSDLCAPKCCACHRIQRAKLQSASLPRNQRHVPQSAAAATKSAHDPPKYCACHANQRLRRSLPRNSTCDQRKRCACKTGPTKMPLVQLPHAPVKSQITVARRDKRATFPNTALAQRNETYCRKSYTGTTKPHVASHATRTL